MFAPIPHNDYHPECQAQDDESVYCQKPGPFALGFFAIISVTADNVEIDLNGFSMEASPEFVAHQRFMAVIELGNSPFINGQGPGNFGDFTGISNVKISNGVLGHSSHHGIHGNDAQGVHISDLTIKHFEVAGIHLNGCLDVVIQNVIVEDSSQEVDFVATLSQAQNLVTLMDEIADQTQTVRINGRGEIEVETLKNELQMEINEALQNTASYSGIFKNTMSGRSDGSFLGGIVVNGGLGSGVAIGEYAGQDPSADKPMGGSVRLENVVIQNFVHQTQEHVHIRFQFPENPEQDRFAVGPFGGLLQLEHATDDGDLGEYQENTLHNAMFALCFLEGLGHTCDQVTWTFLSDWISGDVVELSALLSESEDLAYSFVGNKDAMMHHLKGVAGLRLEHLSELTLKDVHVENLRNYGAESFHHTQYVMEDYRGGDVFGIVLGNLGALKTEGPVTVHGLQAEHGIAAGLAFNGDISSIIHDVNGADWDIQDIDAPDNAGDSIMASFLTCPTTGEITVQLSWDDVDTNGVRSCPLAEHSICLNGEVPNELCFSGSFDYVAVGDGFCRDSNGDMIFLGDWNVDSEEECQSYCNNVFACEGYQYGRDANPTDCNLYGSAATFAPRFTTHSHCMRKTNVLSHDGYSFVGNGYCRGDGGAKSVLMVISAHSEYECKLHCDNEQECQGFEFGTGSNVSKCALYSLATQSTSHGGFGGCWRKN